MIASIDTPPSIKSSLKIKIRRAKNSLLIYLNMIMK